MKKTLAVVLSLVLLISFVGCTPEKETPESASSVLEVSEKPVQTEMTAFDKEEKEIEDPLVICMDVAHAVDSQLRNDPSVAVNDFLMSLEQSGGLPNVMVEYIPANGPERESMLNRLRVELMSGKGPDVFIVNCSGLYGQNTFSEDDAESAPLFMQPQKNMESGLFLPLDTYIENNTRFTEWDKQNEAVLAAGRNAEGQQIIPLVYTMPVICYRQSEVSYSLEKTTTWSDMQNDPAFSTYTKRLADCAVGDKTESGVQVGTNSYGYLSSILGVLADYEDEKLNFTEEELYDRIMEVIDLFNETEKRLKSGEEEPDHYEEHLGWELISDGHQVEANITATEPKMIIPLYSDDGGAVASIMAWAAVNRNTKRPEDAYTVIDMLLREETVVNSWLYADLLLDMTTGITLNDDILSPEKPMRRGQSWNLTAENYTALCAAREQITGANFDSRIDVILNDLLVECVLALRVENPDGIAPVVAEAYEQIQRLVRE